MIKNGNSNATNLLPLMNQMGVTHFPSPCTRHWSLSALRVDFVVHHGFDPGGTARPLARDHDTMSSRHFGPNTFGLLEASVVGNDNLSLCGVASGLMTIVIVRHRERGGGIGRNEV